MTTRAIHLEIAGDLSSHWFILSLRRFIARRGNVNNIRSDNGTNFISAEKELKATINETDREKVMTKIIKKGIHFSWKFNPPREVQPTKGSSTHQVAHGLEEPGSR